MSTNFGKWLRVLTVGLSISALAILSLPVNRAFGGTVYDAVSDFSATANPNGVWSYGWTATLGGPLNLYTNTAPNCEPGIISAWTELTGTCPLPPVIVHNDTDHIIHLAAFPQIAIPPTDLDLHPGPAGEYSVLQWTAPTSGKFKILSLFEGLDSAGPTTTDVHILVYSTRTQLTRSLFSGQITSYHQPSTINFPASYFAAGDMVSFAVGFGADGNYNFDSTGVAARIESK